MAHRGLTRPNANVLTTLPVGPVVGTKRPLWEGREQSEQSRAGSLAAARGRSSWLERPPNLRLHSTHQRPFSPRGHLPRSHLSLSTPRLQPSAPGLTFRAKLETSYWRKPASRRAARPSWYISAASSGSGAGRAPCRTWVKSAVPRSKDSW